MTHQDHLKALSDDYKKSYGFELPWQIPDYSPIKRGDWSVRSRPGGLAASYLAHDVVEPPHAVLYHGREVWMSTGLIEVESHAWHFHCATGNVLVAGLGMGMYLHAASMKPDVKRIVVIERDPDVIALMKETADFERWIHRDKITIIEADAMGEGTGDKVAAAFNDECPDYLYADIWPVFPAPEAPAQTKKMVDLYRPRKAGWWGQEVEFGLWLDDRGRGASLDTLREFFDANGVDASIHDGYLAFCEDTISIQLGDGLERGPFAASAPYGP